MEIKAMRLEDKVTVVTGAASGIGKQGARLAIADRDHAWGLSAEAVVRDVMLKETVDGEFTTVEEVGAATLFFAAFGTNALTGQSLNISHGCSMQ